jgi:hypothetical protein
MKLLCLCGVLATVFMVPLSMVAQDNSALVSKVQSLVYPPLPRMARIQGDVRLRSGPDGVTVVSGHPLLADAAASNLKALGRLSEGDSEVIYHFVFAAEPDIRATQTLVKRGNRFERLLLHAFMMKTEKVVEGTECIENPNRLKNKIDLTKTPIEVWIYGTIPCLQTSVSRIAVR